MIGKFILPWFGSTPGVWTTCMLFFQLLLLAGYTYAHLDRQLAGAAESGAGPRRAIGRGGGNGTHRTVRRLEANRSLHAGSTDPALIVSQRRNALLRPLRDRPAFARLVRADLSGCLPLSTLCAFQRRFALGAVVLPVRLRAVFDAPAAGVVVDVRLLGIRAVVRVVRVDADAVAGRAGDGRGAGRADRLAGRRPNTAVDRRYDALASAGDVRLGGPRGDDQPDVPGHRRRPVFMGLAAVAVPC